MTHIIKNNLFKQDIQIHSFFSDGKCSIGDMVRLVRENKIASCVVTDHAKGWFSKGEYKSFFPTKEKYLEYLRVIDDLKSTLSGSVKIYSGLEVEVDIYGNFNLDKGILDYVKEEKPEKPYGVDLILGSIHSESIGEDYEKYNISQSDRRSVLIQNIINLIQNVNIAVFAHPFQAVHGQFSSNFTEEESSIILDAFKAEWGQGHQIFFEINGKKYPQYEQWVENKYKTGQFKTNDIDFLRKYKSIGGKFVLGSDAHKKEDYLNLDFSVVEELGLTPEDIFIF